MTSISPINHQKQKDNEAAVDGSTAATATPTATATASNSATANIPSLPVSSGDSQHLVRDSSSPLLVGRDTRRAVAQRGKVILAALYAVQVFYSFFIM